MTQQTAEPLSYIASRLAARVSSLTPRGEAALAYADVMDQVVLEAYARLTDGPAQIIWRRRGRPVDPAELEPCLEGLVAHGYLRQTASGYALTPAGEAAVRARDQAHPTRTARVRGIDRSGIDRRTRDEARELAMHRHREGLRTAEELRP